MKCETKQPKSGCKDKKDIFIKNGRYVGRAVLNGSGSKDIVAEYTDKIAKKVICAVEGTALRNGASIHISEKKQHTIYVVYKNNLYTSNCSIKSFLNYHITVQHGICRVSGMLEDELIENVVQDIKSYVMKEGQLYKKACSIIDGEIRPRTGYDRIPAVRDLLKKINHAACAIAIGADGFSIKGQYITPSLPDAILFFPPEDTGGVIIQYDLHGSGEVSVYGGKYQKECKFLLDSCSKDIIRRYIKCFDSYGLDIDINSRSYKYRGYEIFLPTAYELYAKYGDDIENGIHTWMESTNIEISEKERIEEEESEWRSSALEMIAKSDICRDVYLFAEANQHTGIQATEYTILCELLGKKSKNFCQMQHIERFGFFKESDVLEICHFLKDMCRAGVLKKRTMYAKSGPHPMDSAEVMEKEVDGVMYMYCYTYVPTELGNKLFG